MKRQTYLFLSILSGIFIGTSYIPFPPWAVFFCFVPLWITWINTHSIKKVFLYGWICQFILTFIGFNWVAHTASEFGHLPTPIAAIVLLLFCSFANLYIPITGALWLYLTKKLNISGNKKLLLLPCFTSLGEHLVPTIFPWNFGYTFLWMEFPAAQVGEIIGFQGLSFLCHFANLIILQAWLNRKNKKGFAYVLATLISFVLLNAFGYCLKSRLPKPDQSLQFSIIQANIGNLEKQFAEHKWQFRRVILSKYLQLTKEAIEGKELDFFVWPETAFPDDLGEIVTKNRNSLRLRQFIRDHKTPGFIGTYSENPKNQKTTNSFFIVDESGEDAITPYHKTILLAFGEYFPLADKFPFLRDLVPEVGDFAFGNGPEAKEFKSVKYGTQICYEGLFPEFTRKLSQQGTQVIINLTNDSWYGTWQEPYQHLYMTLARAIEFRKPLIRSTNTGISTAIQANGKIEQLSPMHKEWYGDYKVFYSTKNFVTFYEKYFYLGPGLVFIIILTVIGIALTTRKTNG